MKPDAHQRFACSVDRGMQPVETQLSVILRGRGRLLDLRCYPNRNAGDLDVEFRLPPGVGLSLQVLAQRPCRSQSERRGRMQRVPWGPVVSAADCERPLLAL